MENSAQGIEMMMVLITFMSIFLTILFFSLKNKKSDSLGNTYPKELINITSNYWLMTSIYFIAQGVCASFDNLAIIGFGYISAIPSMYYFSKILTHHVKNKQSLNPKKYSYAVIIATTLSFFIYFMDLDYLNFLPLYNSFFTSYLLPISLVAVYPLIFAIKTFIIYGTFRYKPASFHLYLVLLLGVLSVLYYATFRPDPAHTLVGYSSAFLLFCFTCVGIADAIFQEMRGFTNNQINFSNLELLSNSHDQGKKIKNAIFLLKEFDLDAINNQSFLYQAIDILTKVSENFNTIETRTRSTINSARKIQDTICMREIETEIYKEYQIRALRKNINFKIVFDDFIGDQTFLITNKNILIESILNNIIDNSIKFSKPNQSITIKMTINIDNHLEILIEDECGGIPSHTLEKASKFINPETELGTLKELGVGRGLISMFYHLRLIGGEIEIKNKNKGMYAKVILSNSPLINLAPQEQFLPMDQFHVNDTPPVHH